jgi:hypothetical protein
LGGDDDDDYMDVDVDEDGEPEVDDALEKAPMLAKVSSPVDLVCEKEHDPFRGVDNDNEDDDDDDEKPVPPQGDDESNLAVEPAIHNPDPAMEDLVEGLSRLALRTS